MAKLVVDLLSLQFELLVEHLIALLETAFKGLLATDAMIIFAPKDGNSNLKILY